MPFTGIHLRPESLAEPCDRLCAGEHLITAWSKWDVTQVSMHTWCLILYKIVVSLPATLLERMVKRHQFSRIAERIVQRPSAFECAMLIATGFLPGELRPLQRIVCQVRGKKIG